MLTRSPFSADDMKFSSSCQAQAVAEQHFAQWYDHSGIVQLSCQGQRFTKKYHKNSKI
jgi:hypothetical protein